MRFAVASTCFLFLGTVVWAPICHRKHDSASLNNCVRQALYVSARDCLSFIAECLGFTDSQTVKGEKKIMKRFSTFPLLHMHSITGCVYAGYAVFLKDLDCPGFFQWLLLILFCVYCVCCITLCE